MDVTETAENLEILDSSNLETECSSSSADQPETDIMSVKQGDYLLLLQLSGKKLFRRRMELAGKWDALWQSVQDAVKSGTQKNTAYMGAMRKYGYINPKDEKLRLKVEFEGRADKKSAEKGHTELASFEAAVGQLPNRANPREELDWISSHPAMSRKSRAGESCSHIRLNAGDVMHAPNGVAPSKAAVYALQNWCNRPDEFFKQLITEQKKKVDEVGTEKRAETEDDLAETERLLKEVKGAKV